MTIIQTGGAAAAAAAYDHDEAISKILRQDWSDAAVGR